MQPESQIEAYIDAQRAAEFICRSPKTVQAWARAGILPAYAIGAGSKRHWLFLKSELDQWVRGGKE